MTIMLKNVTLAFPALAEAEAVGDGKPAFGTRYIIDPKDTATVGMIEAAMRAVAKDKWKDKADDIYKMLAEDGKLAFSRKEYRSSKTGKTYDGFEGMYHVGTRSEKTKPTAVDRTGAEITASSEIERVFYSGCLVHAKVEFWAQDNSFGRRINATTLGVMFAGEGTRFGGGSSAASASDFAGLASEAEDFV